MSGAKRVYRAVDPTHPGTGDSGRRATLLTAAQIDHLVSWINAREVVSRSMPPDTVFDYLEEKA